jgi:lipoate-protein ligase A
VGQITVNGEQLDTLLSEGSFDKSRPDLHQYAAELDCRMVTPAENRAYVYSLLAKEEDESINAAEANALKTYRARGVRDTQGGLDVDGRRVSGSAYRWRGRDNPSAGALFVRKRP